MDDFLATTTIGNGRTLNVASLSRQTIEECGAQHLGYDGFFVFEASDCGEIRGITILGKMLSFEAALQFGEYIASLSGVLMKQERA